MILTSKVRALAVNQDRAINDWTEIRGAGQATIPLAKSPWRRVIRQVTVSTSLVNTVHAMLASGLMVLA